MHGILFFHYLAFRLYMSLDLMWVSYRQHIYVLFCNHLASLVGHSAQAFQDCWLTCTVERKRARANDDQAPGPHFASDGGGPRHGLVWWHAHTTTISWPCIPSLGKGFMESPTNAVCLSSASASPLSPVSPAFFFFWVHLAIQHLLWLHVNFWQADCYPLYHQETPILFISSSKISSCNIRDLGLILGSGRSSGEGNGYPS